MAETLKGELFMGLKKYNLLLVSIVLELALSGCCSISDKVVGRYKSAECEPEGSSPVICTSVIPKASASVVSIKTPPPSTSKTSGPPESNTELQTLFHRTIIISVSKKGDFNPADRLEATSVTIEPDNMIFVNWDTLATDYTLINAGTVQLTQARTLNENLSAGSPSVSPVTANGSLGGSHTNTRVENYTATIQAETLSATVENRGKKLVIRRQGGPGIDLTGNSIIKVDMSYKGNPSRKYLFSVPKYTDNKKNPLPLKMLFLSRRSVAEVPSKTKTYAKATLVYTLRHVKSGDTTYEEKDDDVLELTVHSKPHKFLLIPEWETSPPTFGLFKIKGKHKNFYLDVKQPGRAPVPLIFDEYDPALNFLAYIRSANTGKLKNGLVVLGNARLGYLDPSSAKNPFIPLKMNELSSLDVQPMHF